MRWIFRGWAALRENRRNGLGMLVAVSACVLLWSLLLSLFYVTKNMLNWADRRVVQERCHLLAATFTEVLDIELQKYTAETEQNDWEEPVWEGTANQAAGEGTFYHQVNEFLEDQTSDVVFFQMDGGSKEEPYGDLEICLRKPEQMDSTAEETFREEIMAVHDTVFDSYGSFDYHDAERGTRIAERETKFVRYQVRVVVTSTLGGNRFSRSTEYDREDCYQPYYTWHVTNLDSRPENFGLYQPLEGTQASPVDGVPVFWNPEEGSFFRDAGGTVGIEPASWYWDEPVDDADSEDGGVVRHIWTEEVAISYVYYDGMGDFHTTYMHFVPSFERNQADKTGEGT